MFVLAVGAIPEQEWQENGWCTHDKECQPLHLYREDGRRRRQRYYIHRGWLKRTYGIVSRSFLIPNSAMYYTKFTCMTYIQRGLRWKDKCSTVRCSDRDNYTTSLTTPTTHAYMYVSHIILYTCTWYTHC